MTDSVEDEDIIIPNSRVPMSRKKIYSFEMTIPQFKDYFLKAELRYSFDYVHRSTPLTRVLPLYKTNGFFKSFKRLENGFCYAEVLSYNQDGIPTVYIVYINSSEKPECIIPIRGNAVNRITHMSINNSSDDMIWLWEEKHPGEERPSSEIKYDKSEFKKICISFDMIEEEIESRACILKKGEAAPSDENDKEEEEEEDNEEKK